MTNWPEDFAAEWRVTERIGKLVRAMRLCEDCSINAEAALRSLTWTLDRSWRRLRIAAQAERLSVWRPWR